MFLWSQVVLYWKVWEESEKGAFHQVIYVQVDIHDNHWISVIIYDTILEITEDT